ncbi:MAG: diaminopimelate epimerase [Bacteriovoracales bacterium]|nr:diaminopimelate epimerase [Bacteriovoracales bacterium]
MEIPFWKMAATGNDFIVIDGFAEPLHFDVSEIQKLCRRKTGIGADGLMVLHPGASGIDFRMQYFNADGFEVEMCGNGARAISFFHHEKNRNAKENYVFETKEGTYFSTVCDDFVKVRMTEIGDEGSIDVSDLVKAKLSTYINIGVPHCVYEVENLESYDVAGEGKRVRHDERFPRGTNCNFFEKKGDHISIRTFERGVEEETLACGTGTVACALALYLAGDRQKTYRFRAPGGELCVEVKSREEVYLCGKVEKIFEGVFQKDAAHRS